MEGASSVFRTLLAISLAILFHENNPVLALQSFPPGNFGGQNIYGAPPGGQYGGGGYGMPGGGYGMPGGVPAGAAGYGVPGGGYGAPGGPGYGAPGGGYGAPAPGGYRGRRRRNSAT